MKRFQLVDRAGTGTNADPYRPDVVGSCVVVAEQGSKLLVKTITEAPADGATIADVSEDGTDIDQTDKAFLESGLLGEVRSHALAGGLTAGNFAKVASNRKWLLTYLLRKMWGREDVTIPMLLGGYDVN